MSGSWFNWLLLQIISACTSFQPTMFPGALQHSQVVLAALDLHPWPGHSVPCRGHPNVSDLLLNQESHCNLMHLLWVLCTMGTEQGPQCPTLHVLPSHMGTFGQERGWFWEYQVFTQFRQSCKWDTQCLCTNMVGESYCISNFPSDHVILVLYCISICFH